MAGSLLLAGRGILEGYFNRNETEYGWYKRKRAWGPREHVPSVAVSDSRILFPYTAPLFSSPTITRFIYHKKIKLKVKDHSISLPFPFPASTDEDLAVPFFFFCFFYDLLVDSNLRTPAICQLSIMCDGC